MFYALRGRVCLLPCYVTSYTFQHIIIIISDIFQVKYLGNFIKYFLNVSERNHLK